MSSGRTGTASWARIGPASTSSGGDVHRAAGDLHAVGERVLDRVPARERGSSAGWVLRIRPGEGVEDRLVEDRAEARPWPPGRPRASCRASTTRGVGRPGRSRRRSSSRSTTTAATPARAATSVAPHGRSTTHGDDRQRAVEHGVEDRPAPRGQHPDRARSEPYQRGTARPAVRGRADRGSRSSRLTVAPTTRRTGRHTWISTSSLPGDKLIAGCGDRPVHLLVPALVQGRRTAAPSVGGVSRLQRLGRRLPVRPLPAAPRPAPMAAIVDRLEPSRRHQPARPARRRGARPCSIAGGARRVPRPPQAPHR